MKVLIYKTDYSVSMDSILSTTFSRVQEIHNWTIDTEDVDKVLKIVASDNLKEEFLKEICFFSGLNIQELN